MARHSISQFEVQALSRRRFLAQSALASAGLLLAPRHLFAQETLPDVVVQGRAAGATAKITVQPLRRNVSVLMGSGGNIGVLPGKDGVLMIDSGYQTSQPQIEEALKGMNAGKVATLVNTHWHFDHTDGNEWVHGTGATIIASEQTRQRLSTPQDMAAFNAHFPAAPAGAIPARTFGDERELNGNDDTLFLVHYEPAHTDSDIYVYFAQANVLHTGDTWFNGFYPFIDYSTGGSIDGMIKATKRNLATAKTDTIIIPGHGPIGDKVQLQAFHEMLVRVRENVARLKKDGKSVDEAIAAKPTAVYDAQYGQGFMKPDVFTRLVYQGV